MLRSYDYPLVEPGRFTVEQLEELVRSTRDSEHPMVIFPEGNRTKDGAIRPFRKTGITAILSSRRWDVYTVVVDGLWQCSKFKEFFQKIGHVETDLVCEGPFGFDGDREEASRFSDELREKMCATLADIRAGREGR